MVRCPNVERNAWSNERYVGQRLSLRNTIVVAVVVSQGGERGRKNRRLRPCFRDQ